MALGVATHGTLHGTALVQNRGTKVGRPIMEVLFCPRTLSLDPSSLPGPSPFMTETPGRCEIDASAGTCPRKKRSRATL